MKLNLFCDHVVDMFDNKFNINLDRKVVEDKFHNLMDSGNALQMWHDCDSIDDINVSIIDIQYVDFINNDITDYEDFDAYMQDTCFINMKLMFQIDGSDIIEFNEMLLQYDRVQPTWFYNPEF